MSNNVHTRRHQDPSTIYVQVPSISQNNNNNIFHATRRDATNPPLNHIPAPQKPSKRQHPSKEEGYQHIDGSVPKPHTEPHTHTKPLPCKIQNPESHKAKSHLPQKKMPPRISRGAKGSGKTYLEGMTRARERGRSGRFGGEGGREVGTSSAVSCWEVELGVVIFGEER